MLRNIMSMGAKAILGLAIVSFATPTEALAQKHGGGHGGGGHHGGSSTWHGGSGWHHGGSNWGHGYYNGGYYGYYPGYYYGGWGAYWPYYLGYALPYRGYSSSYGYYPDYSYYPDYGYDEGYVAAPVESARINVRVPPDATVLVNGVRMRQTGPVRQYVTPPLEPGYQYSYEIRASWMTPAGAMNNSRTVWVNPGDNITVNLNLTAPAAFY